MARYGAWSPLPGNPNTGALTADILCVHTMVGGLAGTDATFRKQGYAGTFSHFGVGPAGQVVQWQDTAYRGAANLNGNHRIISVETADLGAPFPAWNTNADDVPAWTPEQLDALARLIAWACAVHDIPCELIPDSKAGRRGIGYHRQGCDGDYPDGRVSGGELWSSARGKVCPGNRRIAQIPGVLATAARLLDSGNTPASTPKDPEMELSDLLPDLYPDVPVRKMSVGDTLAWSAAHAARAETQAINARNDLADYRKVTDAKLDAILAAIKASNAPGPDPDTRYRLVPE